MLEIFPELICGFVVGITYVDSDSGLDEEERGIIIELGIIRLIIIYHG